MQFFLYLFLWYDFSVEACVCVHLSLMSTDSSYICENKAVMTLEQT